MLIFIIAVTFLVVSVVIVKSIVPTFEVTVEVAIAMRRMLLGLSGTLSKFCSFRRCSFEDIRNTARTLALLYSA